jgi:hypothetical protein
MPDISPENEELLECFRLCESQLRATDGGAYAMDWNVVIVVAESMSIPIDGLFYRLLRHYESILLATDQEESHGRSRS